jgi:hypothetical protein
MPRVAITRSGLSRIHVGLGCGPERAAVRAPASGWARARGIALILLRRPGPPKGPASPGRFHATSIPLVSMKRHEPLVPLARPGPLPIAAAIHRGSLRRERLVGRTGDTLREGLRPACHSAPAPCRRSDPSTSTLSAPAVPRPSDRAAERVREVRGVPRAARQVPRVHARRGVPARQVHRGVSDPGGAGAMPTGRAGDRGVPRVSRGQVADRVVAALRRFIAALKK